jgi:pSer/pThr/pTyr-binding forkhead associated (FHA) protein
LLTISAGQLSVEDLTSANGTFLNDQRVSGIQLVNSGDQLRIGNLTFLVQMQSTKTALAALDTALEAGREVDPNDSTNLIDVVPFEPEDKKKHTTPPPPKKKKSAKKPVEKIPVDDDEPIDLPEGKDFRDFLSQMEE